MDEQQKRQAAKPPSAAFTFGQKASIFGGSAIITCGLPALLHAPLPMEIAGIIGAVALARKSPEIYEAMRQQMPLLPVAPKNVNNLRESGEYTFTDRLLGRHLNQPVPIVSAFDPIGDSHETDYEEMVDTEPLQYNVSSNKKYQTYQYALPEKIDNDVVENDIHRAIAHVAQQSVVENAPPSIADIVKNVRICLGIDASGKPVYRTLEVIKAILILGMPGSGKTTTVLSFIVQFLRPIKGVEGGTRLVVIDPEGEGDNDESLTHKLAPFSPFFDIACGITPQTAMAAIEYVEQVFDARVADKRNATYPLLFIVDEFTDIMEQMKSDGKWSMVAKRLNTLMQRLNARGRKHGIYSICIGQVANADSLGGTKVRSLFSTRIVHRMKDGTMRMLGLNKYEDQIKTLKRGRAIIDMDCFEEEVSSDPFAVHVSAVGDDDVERIAKNLLATRKDAFLSKKTVQQKQSFADIWEQGEEISISVEEQEALLAELYSSPDIDPEDKRYECDTEPLAVVEEVKTDLAPVAKPVIEDKGPRAEDIDIDVLIAVWNGGGNSVRKLMKIFKMTNHQAKEARKRILKCQNVHVEEADEPCD
jgi:hypothetical protein